MEFTLVITFGSDNESLQEALVNEVMEGGEWSWRIKGNRVGILLSVQHIAFRSLLVFIDFLLV